MIAKEVAERLRGAGAGRRQQRSRRPRTDKLRQVRHAQRRRRGVLQEVRIASWSRRRREAAHRPLLALLASSVALAQPMMIDPSRMSGIPRPDPQVPPGTITVRLIRGELSNRMTGVEVGLGGPDGKIVSRRRPTTRAAPPSPGLSAPGPYQARATDGDEELTSQSIELQSDMGSRVMLVFQPKGGAADGVARPDKTLPGGTVIVRAAGEGGEPVVGRRHRARPRARGRAGGDGAQGQDRRPGRGEVHRARRQAGVGLPRRGAQGRPALRGQAVQAHRERGRARHRRRAAGVEGCRRAPHRSRLALHLRRDRRRRAGGRGVAPDEHLVDGGRSRPERAARAAGRALAVGAGRAAESAERHGRGARGRDPRADQARRHRDAGRVRARLRRRRRARLRAAHAARLRRRGDGDREDRRPHRRRAIGCRPRIASSAGASWCSIAGRAPSRAAPSSCTCTGCRTTTRPGATWRRRSRSCCWSAFGIYALRGKRSSRDARAARAAARAPHRRAGGAREERRRTTSGSARSRS